MRDYENSIVYAIVEVNVLSLINVIKMSISEDDIIDKEEILNEDFRLYSFRYSIINDRYLDIYVEEDRIIYLILDKDFNEIDECIVDLDGMMNLQSGV